MASPWLLLLLTALLSSSFFGAFAAASSSSSSSSQQRRRLLQSSSPPARNIETFFPSNAVSAFINPPSPPPPPPSAPPFAVPTPLPSRKSSTVTIAGAVVATAASTFVVSGLLFFAVHRFAFKQRKVESDQQQLPRENKFQGDGGGGGATAAGNPYRAPRVNGMLKAVVLDEDGLDVLYWRKVEDGTRKRCAHCMQVVGGDGEDRGAGGRGGSGGSRDGDGGGRGRDGSHREQVVAGRRGRPPREDRRRVQETPLLPADSLSSSDRIKLVHSMDSELSSMSGGAVSMRAAADAVVAESRAVEPTSPRLPLPPGRRGAPSNSPSPASPSSSLPAPTVEPGPSSPPSPKRLSAVAAPPAPAPPAPPPPSASPPSPSPPAVAKRSAAVPPPPPPQRPPPAGHNIPGPPAPPPAPGAGRPSGPPPFRPPPVPRLGSRSAAGEGTSEENAKAPTKLKPLHWDKMTTANAQHSMVWDKISDGSFRFDDDLMEALFGYVATNRKSPKKGASSSNPFDSAAAGGPPAQICLLDPRKSQNTAIVLKSLAVTRQEILDALMEGRGLSADTLEKLSKLAPTKEEEGTLLGFDGNPSSLADAESFLFHLLRAIPSAFARVDAMLLKANYAPEVLHLRESLQALEAACRELRKQGLFWKMLEAVLKAGNRMNAGTARGNAQAFNLSSLRKLSDVKSIDGKTTLLHFVVESVVRSEGKRCVVNRNHSFGRSASRSAAGSSSSPAPGAPTREEKEMEYMTLGLPVVGGLSIEFANVKKAAAVDYDALVGACAVLGARIAAARQLLATCGGGGGGFVGEMGGFLERAEGELRALREEQARVVELVKKTTEYYMVGAGKDKTAPPLQLFLIVKDFLGMVDQACVDISRNLQQQRRKAASGVGSPPSGHQRRAPTRFPNLPAHFMSENSKSSASSSSGGGGSNSNSDSEEGEGL